MGAEPVLIDHHGAVARITLNRPQAANSINLPLARAFADAVDRCADDPAVRCVLLTGQGRFFCAGGDVTAFAEAGDDVASFINSLTERMHAATRRLVAMDKPLVTAINGPAAGAGLSLAMLGDVALAAASSHFTLAYGAIGLTPDGGATWLLPRLIGLRRAQEFAFTGMRLAAQRAADWGLVTRVVEDAALLSEGLTAATALAKSATGAIAITRNLLYESFSAMLATRLDQEARAIAASSQSAHARTALAAYLQRRPAVFDQGN